jgi:hypothetical protein
MFDGLNMSLGNLSLLSRAQSRSISPENFDGAKGAGGMATEGTGAECARDLGRGWKISPSVRIEPGQVFEMAVITGPGAIQQIWMTPTGTWRQTILRFYWDHEETPSVECPVGDFFGMGWGEYAHLNSLPVCVNPGSAFNCYWEMPFRQHCRITVENLAAESMVLYYQVNYTLTDIPDDAGYLHAQWRRSNPLTQGEAHTLLDGVRGHGQYVGTCLAWQVNNTGWWGEGEIKFYLDGDAWPTICGTGTEDYFCGSYNFDRDGEYTVFSTAYAGLHQVIKPDGAYRSQQRFGMYRWHIMDPVRFQQDLRVTIQALGWRSGGRYLPLQDDIASVSFWYQREPHAPFPALPGKDGLEIV